MFTFLAVIIGTVIVTLLLPNRYESRMKILVKNQRVDVAIMPEATNGANTPIVENEVSENQINSEIELLTSSISQQRSLTIDVLDDRGAMLADVRAQVSLIKRDLSKLMLALRSREAEEKK